MSATPTDEEIAEGLRRLETSGCAKRQHIEGIKAQIEVRLDLEVAALWVGEEIEPRKYGALES